MATSPLTSTSHPREIQSGNQRNVPYSFSRWTEVPGDPLRWSWFLQQLDRGVFDGFDPLDGIFRSWSILPEDTQELILWTKNPGLILASLPALAPFHGKISVHVTMNGWGPSHERGVPPVEKIAPLFGPLIDAFGVEAITWRISPVPTEAGKDHFDRLFDLVAKSSSGSRMPKVFLSFVQTNARVPVPSETQKKETLRYFQDRRYSICWDDREATGSPGSVGVCSPPRSSKNPLDTCGCSLAVDPFGYNESCIFACDYCYVVENQGLLQRKRNNSLSGVVGVRGKTRRRLHLL